MAAASALGACGGAASSEVGRLQNPEIDEASGIVASPTRPGVFWIVNDSGPPLLHAIDDRGRQLGRVTVAGATLVDWEDLAAFVLDGRPYLAIADIGDNSARRDRVHVYVVAEPGPDEETADIAWEFGFSYPGGPRDAEAMAIDAATGRLYVLGKRELPAALYELPLRPEDDAGLVARRLTAVDSLPQPQPGDRGLAPLLRYWWWQPTAMDFAADGSAAVILTYGGAYLYRREAGTDWSTALRGRPSAVVTGRLGLAESAAFGPGADSVYITLEGSRAPLLRIDLQAPEST